jgi:hypothetical protein
MARMSIALTGVLVVVLVSLTVGPPGTAQERKDDAATFEGQFVSIVTRSNPTSSTDLARAQIRKLDGRSFVVGIGADVPDNWQKGRTVWVALDDVSEVTVFATLEDLRKANIPGDGK